MSEQDAVTETTEPTDEEIVEALVESEGAEAETETDELEEAELDGKKVRVSKGYKDYLLREQDYRHKTHELGQSKAQIEQRARDLEQQERVMIQFSDEIGEIKALDKQIKEYKDLTPTQWLNWRDQDREAADKGQFAMQLLITRRGELAQSVDQKIGEAHERDTRANRERSAAAEAALKAAIPDWTPEKEKTVKAHVAQKYGFQESEIDGILNLVGKDPRVVKFMNDAFSRDSAMKSARERIAASRAGTPTEPVVPVRKVGGNGANANGGKPTGSLLKTNADAWDKAFMADRKRHFGR